MWLHETVLLDTLKTDQGVVTYMLSVEVFVSRIKIFDRQKFQGLIDQGDLLAAEIMHQGNDQAHFLLKRALIA